VQVSASPAGILLVLLVYYYYCWCTTSTAGTTSTARATRASARRCTRLLLLGVALNDVTAHLRAPRPVCSEQVRPVEGRPFTSAGADLVADVGWAQPPPLLRAAGWARGRAPVPARADGADVDAALGELWLTHAQHEHASIASFSRYSLELLKCAPARPERARALGSADRARKRRPWQVRRSAAPASGSARGGGRRSPPRRRRRVVPSPAASFPRW
jgi:hypothetical protein